MIMNNTLEMCKLTHVPIFVCPVRFLHISPTISVTAIRLLSGCTLLHVEQDYVLKMTAL